jgi:hypothetical protein
MASKAIHKLPVVLAILTLAGCGSGSERPRPQPQLPAAVASELANGSDRIAVALEAGDSCRALDEARVLRQDTIAAINERRVPVPFQEPLLASVNDLVSRIACVPPADEEADEDDEGEDGRGKGKRNGKKGRD